MIFKWSFYFQMTKNLFKNHTSKSFIGLAVAGVADELPNPNPPVVPPLPNVDELNIFYSLNLKEYQSGKEKKF